MEVGKGGDMGTERDFDGADGCTMQCADDVLLSCTLDTCMSLQTNVTPINSIKKYKNKIKSPTLKINE